MSPGIRDAVPSSGRLSCSDGTRGTLSGDESRCPSFPFDLPDSTATYIFNARKKWRNWKNSPAGGVRRRGRIALDDVPCFGHSNGVPSERPDRDATRRVCDGTRPIRDDGIAATRRCPVGTRRRAVGMRIRPAGLRAGARVGAGTTGGLGRKACPLRMTGQVRDRFHKAGSSAGSRRPGSPLRHGCAPQRPGGRRGSGRREGRARPAHRTRYLANPAGNGILTV